jgi:hypothetical protein
MSLSAFIALEPLFGTQHKRNVLIAPQVALNVQAVVHVPRAIQTGQS